MLLAEKFSVGNRAIDLEHNNLFTTINWLFEAIVAGKVRAMSERLHFPDGNGAWLKLEEKRCIGSLVNCLFRHIKGRGPVVKAGDGHPFSWLEAGLKIICRA